MARIVCLDFETYWSSDYTLTKMSPVAYIRDPRFYAQCMSYSVNLGPVQVCNHDEIPKILESLKLDTPNTYTIGHNISGFDGLIISEIYHIYPSNILDTMAMTNWTGVSRVMPRNNLASVAKFFRFPEKQMGTDTSKGKRLISEFSPEEWEFFTEYCRQDTFLVVEAVKRMAKYITDDAIRFMSLSAKMATEPKFIIDPEPLKRFLDELSVAEAEAQAKLESLFNLPPGKTFRQALRSADTLARMLTLLGVDPPMKKSPQKTETQRRKLLDEGLITPETPEEDYVVYTYAFSKTDQEFTELLDHPDPRVRELVRMRLDYHSSVPRARTEALIRAADYHLPVPIFLKTFHAHTSRYGAGTVGKSDGLNFQNMSKRDHKMKAIRQAITVPPNHSVVACDSSQIECRVLAYVANQTDLLDQFRDKADPYAELASKFGFGYGAKEIHDGAKNGDDQMYKLRFAGKTLVLSAGYGVGKDTVAKALRNNGIILDENKATHNAMAADFLKIYRATNSHITGFWQICDNVLLSLIRGEEGRFGGPNNDLFEYGLMPLLKLHPVPSIKLPTGFILRYPNLRFSDEGPIVYTKQFNGKPVPNKIYGGMLTENLIQALAFQILMWQACRMDEKGIHIHANIHDSFASVVPTEIAPEVLKKMLNIMKTVPPFVPNLPIDAEGEIGTNFEVV